MIVHDLDLHGLGTGVLREHAFKRGGRDMDCS
jgi:hypothetical protein